MYTAKLGPNNINSYVHHGVILNMILIIDVIHGQVACSDFSQNVCYCFLDAESNSSISQKDHFVTILRFSRMFESRCPAYLPHVSDNGSVCPRVLGIHPYFPILVDNQREGFIKPPEKEVQWEET